MSKHRCRYCGEGLEVEASEVFAEWRSWCPNGACDAAGLWRLSALCETPRATDPEGRLRERVIYLAHPVAPTGIFYYYDRGVNLACARSYRQALKRAGVTVSADWIEEIGPDEEADADPVTREAGLRACEARAAEAWAVAPCGLCLSAPTDGMRREIAACGRHIRGVIGRRPEQAAEVVRAAVVTWDEGWA